MTVIFDWKDKRAMLECLSDSVHDLRLCLVRDVAPSFPEFAEELEVCLVRDVAPSFPEFAEELEAVGGDLTAAIDKLYTIMERSLAKDAEDLDV